LRPEVKIKIEPGTEDDEVVFCGEKTNDASSNVNIVYELIEEEISDLDEEEEEAEEEEEEVEEEVEEEEEEVEEAEEEEEPEEEEPEADEEVYETKIKGKSYYVTNEKNGTIYAIDKNGDVSNKVGQYQNGVAKFD
jgi:hypothetical protein